MLSKTLQHKTIHQKSVLSRPEQIEYVAALKKVTGMDKSLENPGKCLPSSEIHKCEMYVQRVKDFLTEEFINPFQTK